MDRGENQVVLKLPIEAMLPLLDFQHERRLGSKNQACSQIVILWLHEHGYLKDEQLDSIKERTKIFRTDKEFIEQKVVEYREKITERMVSKIETKIQIPQNELKYLKNIKKTILTLPLGEWRRFADGYRRTAERNLPHPLAKEVLVLLDYALSSE